jgi:predicted PurR-regulated permease PerM
MGGTQVGEQTSFTTRKAVTYVGVAATLVALGAAVVLAAELFLLLFGAIVFAVFIRSLSDYLAEKTPLGPQLALATVLLVLLILAVLSVVLLAPGIAEQFEKLTEQLPSIFRKIEESMKQMPGGRRMLSQLNELGGENGEEAFSFVDALSLSLGGLLNILIVLITGIYLAAQPGMYREGVVRLFPISWRGRAGEVLAALGSTLRWFLLGRVVSMIAVGVVTWIGLMLIGVPAAALLGLVAGALTFVPYAGPIAASIPIGLAALLEGPAVLAYALIFYTFVQMVEGFFITPLVQEKVVTLPPAVTLAAEVFMGLLFGAVGVILSVPAAALGVKFVRMVYVGDVLGDHENEDA